MIDLLITFAPTAHSGPFFFFFFAKDSFEGASIRFECCFYPPLYVNSHSSVFALARELLIAAQSVYGDERINLLSRRVSVVLYIKKKV